MPRVSGGTIDMGAHEHQTPEQQPSLIRLLSLNTGETIDTGMPYDIAWEAPASALSFKVFYSLDNGLTWLKAKSADPAVTGNIVTGQRHFRWAVPVLTKNKKAKVKVIGFIGPNGTGAKVGVDVSDLPFLLRAMTLLKPNGPDPLQSGGSYVITWAMTENPAAGVTHVKLTYTTDGGLTWKPIAMITGNTGRHPWTVPAVARPKIKCKVKVTLYGDMDGNGTPDAALGSDTSDLLFTIGP